MRQCLAPPFHLAASQSRPEPGRLYKATEHQLPPTSSTCCSFVNSHRPPGAVVSADGSAEPHLVNGVKLLCPMVTRSRHSRPRTFQPWSFLGIVAEMLSHLRAPAWHWSITQIAELSVPAAHDGFTNSYRKIWRCGRRDTLQATAGMQSRLNRRDGLDLRQLLRPLPVGTARQPHRRAQL